MKQGEYPLVITMFICFTNRNYMKTIEILNFK
jgi:hypothetical protein